MTNQEARAWAKQAGLDVYALGARRDMWEERLVKYAQLVAEECRLIVVADPERAADLIKEHFDLTDPAV